MSKKYLVSFEFLPYLSGGLARHAYEMIARILTDNESYEAIIAVPLKNGVTYDEKITPIPCILYTWKYLRYIEFAIKLYFRFGKNFKHSKFIFFSSFSYLFNPFLPKYFYLFIMNTSKRVFMTNYPGESIKMRYIRKITYFILSKWENYMANKSTKIFSISKSTTSDIITQYHVKKKKIKEIPCGINLNIFQYSKPRTKNNKNLLYVGRIVPRKNLLELILVLKQLTTYDPQYKLHIVGDGEKSYFMKVNEIVKKYGLEKNILFHGFYSDKELNEFYKKCGLFVFTSLVEGFGLVLLEAMSKGLPAIAYNINGVKDVVINNNNGYLIKAGDINEFVNKILYLGKKNTKYRQLSLNATKRVHDFDWNTSVDKLTKEIN